jgi:hypothetical protein
MKVFAQFMALYFFLGSFFPWTDFSQLTKIPNVFKHYECHVEESVANGETSVFTDFLKEHFFSSMDQAHQDPTHHQLPLKTINLDFQFVLSKVLPFQLKMPILQKVNFFNIRTLLGADFSSSLFQPPIFA